MTMRLDCPAIAGDLRANVDHAPVHDELRRGRPSPRTRPARRPSPRAMPADQRTRTDDCRRRTPHATMSVLVIRAPCCRSRHAPPRAPPRRRVRSLPGCPAARAHVVSASRVRACRSRSVSSVTASATTLRREVILNQLGHDAAAGNEIRHRVHVDVDERLARADRSAATADRQRPSAARAARTARSPCPRR